MARITDNTISFPKCECGHRMSGHLRFNRETLRWEVGACTHIHECSCQAFKEEVK